MIRLQVIGSTGTRTIGVYVVNEDTGDTHLWLEQPVGPIEGYPFPLCAPGKTHTVRSVTPQVDTLRSLSSPTLRYTDACGLIVWSWWMVERPMRITLSTRAREYKIPSARINVGDVCYVRATIRDDIINDEFIGSYLECALWSSTMMPEDSEVYDMSYHRHGCEVSDVSLETAIGAKRDCDAFRAQCETDLDDSEVSDEKNGHNFWLSRNGHGAGFFDACDAIGDRLQESARVFGEVNLYHVDDDDIVIYSDADVDTLGSFDLDTVWS